MQNVKSIFIDKLEVDGTEVREFELTEHRFKMDIGEGKFRVRSMLKSDGRVWIYEDGKERMYDDGYLTFIAKELPKLIRKGSGDIGEIQRFN